MADFKNMFSKTLAGHSGWLHFAAHSHHLWPDASEQGHMRAWQDAAHLADRKWDKVFAEVIPEARRNIAELLSLPDYSTLAFAPNTHEFVLRLISCLPANPKILTSDSEFHSASRQLRRLEELGLAEITRISTQPFVDFSARFANEAKSKKYDMVFLSQVFFNSGFVLPDIAEIASATPPESMLVIDGYHAFMALPVDLSAVAGRIFYIAGGYKYAMSGEGCCFMHCPPYFKTKPANTGWYAAFGALEKKQEGALVFAAGGNAFMGATFDPSALYRFNAVQEMLKENRLDVSKIHEHVVSLQQQFLANIGKTALDGLLLDVWPDKNLKQQAHFLTFVTPKAAMWHELLLQDKIITDVRGDRLRLGFGLYHNHSDISELLEKLANVRGIMLSEQL